MEYRIAENEPRSTTDVTAVMKRVRENAVKDLTSCAERSEVHFNELVQKCM